VRIYEVSTRKRQIDLEMVKDWLNLLNSLI
jgi:hypothetical protein